MLNYLKKWWFKKHLPHWIGEISYSDNSRTHVHIPSPPDKAVPPESYYCCKRGNIEVRSDGDVLVDGKLVMSHNGFDYIRLNYGAWVYDIRDWYLGIQQKKKIARKARFQDFGA